MTEFKRPLAGTFIGLSISESDDSENLGFPAWQIDRTLLQVVSALFGQGVSVVFGHDWRDDGVMSAIHGFALQMQAPLPLSSEEAAKTGQPLLLNLLPWPDKPRLAESELEQLKATLNVKRIGVPAELKSFEEAALKDIKSPLYAYLRARGLTNLRHELNKATHARLCLGGRSKSQGRYSGIVEEALLAIRMKKPLYLSGVLGGVTKLIIDAIEGGNMPDNFCPPSPISELYFHLPTGALSEDSPEDKVCDRNSAWAEFMQYGVEGIAASNGLSRQENAELFHTPVLDEAIRLVLTGLSRLVS